MFRRLVIGFGLFLLIVAAGLGLLVVERIAVTQALVENRLAALDVPDIRVEVREIGWSRAVVADIAAGDALRVGRIVVGYDLRDLLDLRPPRIDRIDIEDLRMDAGKLDEGPVARLRAGMARSDREPASLPARIGRIGLHDAVVDVPTPWGGVTLRIDGAAGPLDGPAIPVDIAAEATSAFGLLVAEFKGTAGLAGNVDGDITMASDRFVMDRLTATDVAGRLTVSVATGRLPSLAGRATVGALNSGEISIGAAALVARLDDGAGAVDLTLRASHHKAEIRLTADRTDDAARPALTLAVDAEIDAASDVRMLAGPLAPARGRATLSVVAAGRPVLGDAPPSPPADFLRELAAGGWRASVAVDLHDVTHDHWVRGLSATVGVDVAVDDDAVTVSLPAPALLDVDGIDAAALRRVGLPLDLARQVAGASSVSIAARHADPAQARIAVDDGRMSFGAVVSAWADGAAPLAVSSALDGVAVLTPTPRVERLAFDRLDAELRDLTIVDQRFSRLQLSANGTAADDQLAASGLVSLALPALSAGAVTARDIVAELPVEIDLTQQRLVVTPTAEANVQLRALTVADVVDMPQLLILTLTPRGDTAITVPFDDAMAVRAPHDLVATSNDMTARIAVGDEMLTLRAEPLTVEIAGGLSDNVAHAGRIRLSTPALSVPEHDLTIGGVDIRMRTGPTIEAAFSIAEAVHPMASPMALDGEATLAGDIVTFAARPRIRDTDIRADIGGRHDLAAGRGGASVTLPAIVFAPDGPRPDRLSPLLSEFSQVSGTVDASAALTWDADGVDGAAEARLDDLSFTTAGVKIAGLSTAPRFTGLSPLTTAPGQLLTIRSIDAGVPLRDLTARFGLAVGKDGGGARLDLSAADVAFAGGRISLVDAQLNTAKRENLLTLHFDRVDFAELLKLVELEGLSGTGMLSGALPIVIRDARIAVQKGTLAATGDGVLRYRSPTARQALEAGGESVELLLQALENFHYDRLSLAIDKTMAGETAIRLQTEGKNPDVLDGQPFAININLSGNADQILAAVLEGFRLSDRALRAIVQ